MKLPRTAGAVAMLGIAFGVPFLWSQDLGDIARQERERRSRLGGHAPVITNEDLAREHILTPELMNQILRTQAGKGAAVPLPPPDLTGYVPLPLAISAVQQLHNAALQPAAIGVVQPNAEPGPAVPAEAVTALARQLPSARAANLDPVYAGSPENSIAAREPEISFGEFARQLRASRVALVESQTPEVTPSSPASQPDQAISLGEYARQLQSQRNLPEPLAVSGVATVSPVGVDSDEPVSLGGYARQLRTIRTVPLFESASIVPVAPTSQAKLPGPEISLGEYARQLRMRHSAEEYFRLLAQDDLDIAAVLRQANAPLRYHEIRPSLSLAMRDRQTAVVASQPDASPVRKGSIAVKVRRGDSLWRLARTYLGSGARWQSISFLNRHTGSPNLIRAGEVVLVPVSDDRRTRARVQSRRRHSRSAM